jgi:8-oxo-dGTP diphosphatase
MTPQRVTVGVILVDARGRVLMQLRDDKPDIFDPACWAVPGGGRDPGESLEQAARREILEETGYRIDQLELRLELDLDRGDGFIERQAYFLSRYDDVQTLHCHEGQKIEFIDPNRLHDLTLTPGLGPIIRKIVDDPG